MRSIKSYIQLIEMMDDNFEITMDRHHNNIIAHRIRKFYAKYNILTNFYHVSPDEIFTQKEIDQILENVGFLEGLVEMSKMHTGDPKFHIPETSHVNRMLEFLSEYFEGKTLNSGEYKNPPLPPKMY